MPFQSLVYDAASGALPVRIARVFTINQIVVRAAFGLVMEPQFGI
jgi:hypothetical protein